MNWSVHLLDSRVSTWIKAFLMFLIHSNRKDRHCQWSTLAVIGRDSENERKRKKSIKWQQQQQCERRWWQHYQQQQCFCHRYNYDASQKSIHSLSLPPSLSNLHMKWLPFLRNERNMIFFFCMHKLINWPFNHTVCMRCWV